MSELQERAAKEGRSFKDQVNSCLERALGRGAAPASPWKAVGYHLGGGRVDLSRAWELVDELETQAYAAKKDLGK